MIFNCQILKKKVTDAFKVLPYFKKCYTKFYDDPRTLKTFSLHLKM